MKNMCYRRVSVVRKIVIWFTVTLCVPLSSYKIWTNFCVRMHVCVWANALKVCWNNCLLFSSHRINFPRNESICTRTHTLKQTTSCRQCSGAMVAVAMAIVEIFSSTKKIANQIEKNYTRSDNKLVEWVCTHACVRVIESRNQINSNLNTMRTKNAKKEKWNVETPKSKHDARNPKESRAFELNERKSESSQISITIKFL